MPLPPGQVPGRRQCHRHQGLGKEEVCRQGREQDPFASRSPQECIAPGRDGIQDDPGHGQEEGKGLDLRGWPIQRWQGGQGHGGPDEHHGEQDPAESTRTHDLRHGVGAGDLPGRAQREQRADPHADGCRRDEPDIRLREQHARRGERVQPQEARRGEEREGDIAEAGVPALGGSVAGGVGEHRREQRRAEDEPEVGRVVLPLHVQPGITQQDAQADQRQGEGDHRAGQGCGLLAPGAVAGHSCLTLRCWWTSDRTTEPSPTAEATRLTDPARTSPTAKMPGTEVSCGRTGTSGLGAVVSVPVRR